jgi:hypothetical protein
MIAIPAIALCGILAMLSMVGALILTKPWMKYVAIGCAVLETAMVIFLVIIAS